MWGKFTFFLSYFFKKSQVTLFIGLSSMWASFKISDWWPWNAISRTNELNEFNYYLFSFAINVWAFRGYLQVDIQVWKEIYILGSCFMLLLSVTWYLFVHLSYWIFHRFYLLPFKLLLTMTMTFENSSFGQSDSLIFTFWNFHWVFLSLKTKDRDLFSKPPIIII